MDKGTKYFILSVGVFIFFVIGFLAYQAWKSAEEAAMFSCLSSGAAEIEKGIIRNKFKFDNQPRELTRPEVEQLLKEIKPYDCSGSPVTADEIHVSVGDVNKTMPSIKVKVWTNAADEIAGTSDDLVIPYGDKVY